MSNDAMSKQMLGKVELRKLSKTGRELMKKEALLLLLFIAPVFLLLSPLSPLKVSFMAVASGSMRPTLEVGDLIVVKHCTLADINVGDMAVYKAPSGEIIVHRATEVHREEAFIITKGDANPVTDPWRVRENDVIGKVIFRFPYVGYIALNPYVKLCIVVAAVSWSIVIIANTLARRESLPRNGFATPKKCLGGEDELKSLTIYKCGHKSQLT